MIPDAECLSHRLASGQRNWLNAELWGAATCQVENGPLISYGSFVWPVFGGAVCGNFTGNAEMIYSI